MPFEALSRVNRSRLAQDPRRPTYSDVKVPVSMEVWLKLVTTTSSWRRRKTRHEGQKMVWNVVVIVRAPLRNKEKGACRTHEGLPVRYWRKVGMTSSPHGPYGLGHTREEISLVPLSSAKIIAKWRGNYSLMVVKPPCSSWLVWREVIRKVERCQRELASRYA